MALLDNPQVVAYHAASPEVAQSLALCLEELGVLFEVGCRLSQISEVLD